MQATTDDIADVRREMRKLIAPIQDAQDATNSRVDSIAAAVQTTASQGAFNEIVNILSNSHPEWSKSAYAAPGVLPADAGDSNLEAANWYRQLAADTLLAETSANAVKAAKTIEPADHTLWAANEGTDADISRWDKTNGTIELGGITERWDLFHPLPDIVFPGQVYYVQFEAMLRTTSAAPDVQVYAGIYDDTAGQRKYIEGGSFTITDDAGNSPGVTYGIPGSTSVDYKVIAFTDSGEQAESNVLNFPNAPATFDANNHPRVKFAGVPGFIKFEIYRKIGSTYVLQYTVGNTIEGVYYDIGNPPQSTVSGFPTVTDTKPKAYAVTSSFQPGSLNGLGWVRHAMTIFVPTTYNRGLTGAGMQYFRWGLTGNTDDVRQILVRRFGLSMGSGKWARSAEDVRPGVHSAPSSTATGAGSSGTGGIDPPPPGGGGGCVPLDTILSLLDRDIPLKDAAADDLTDSGGPVCGKIRKVRLFQTNRLFTIETASGKKIKATFDHPFITGVKDFNGTPCMTLKTRFERGDDVFLLTRQDGVIRPDKIVVFGVEHGDFWVGIPTCEGSHIILLNEICSHNNKGGIDEVFAI